MLTQRLRIYVSQDIQTLASQIGEMHAGEFSTFCKIDVYWLKGTALRNEFLIKRFLEASAVGPKHLKAKNNCNKAGAVLRRIAASIE